MVTRFAYVASPVGEVVHRFYARSFAEGEKASCGVRLKPGWVYWVGGKKTRRRICKRCESVRS